MSTLMERNILLTIMLILLMCMNSYAQLNVKEKVKDETNSRIDQRTTEAINKGLDKIEEGVGSVFKKKNKKEKQEDPENETANGSDSNTNDEANNEVVKQVDSKTTRFSSYTKFDFVAGEKVIFYDDFNEDPIGEFPAKWNTNNSAELVKIEGLDGKWLNIPPGGGNYFPELKLSFPENITIEFDMIFNDDIELGMTYYSEENFDVDAYGVPGDAGFEVVLSNPSVSSFHNYKSDDNSMETNGESNKGKLKTGEVNHISLWVQKTRFRIYIDESKVFDIPKGVFSGFVYNRFRFFSYNSSSGIFLSNVRIAVGAPDTRNQLITEGKLVTRGILFDVNSDQIRPESYGCIKEIADVLKENPTVAVTIVGHTDSDGDAAKNLDLSKRRAASVKNFLVSEFSIEASRMTTDGKGATDPVESNSTAVGKAQNRRVEFIKL